MKVIQRNYIDPNSKEIKKGFFIAMGQWADGHLAYTFCDVLGNPLSNYEEGMWAQVRQYGKLLMIHI